MSKNLLLQRREKVARLETALNEAREQKLKADETLAKKLAQIAAAKPVLADGVISEFFIDKNNRRLPQMPESERLTVLGGAMVLAKDGGAPFEQEAARQAHSRFVEASNNLSRAKQELTDFENELRKLQSNIECLKDL